MNEHYTAEVFTDPPYRAFRRQNNIGEYLLMVKVPSPKSSSKRDINEMTKCNTPCQSQSFLKAGSWDLGSRTFFRKTPDIYV